jgi:hypothetical protein
MTGFLARIATTIFQALYEHNLTLDGGPQHLGTTARIAISQVPADRS